MMMMMMRATLGLFASKRSRFGALIDRGRKGGRGDVHGMREGERIVEILAGDAVNARLVI